MKKRLLALTMSGMMLMGMFTGCSSGDTGSTGGDATAGTTGEGTTSGGGDGVTIVVATNRTDIVDSKLKDLADAYMAENEGITIQFEAVKDYDSTVGTQVSGGAAPDIYQVLASLSQDVYPDYFVPLDDLGFSEDDLYYYEANRVGDSVYVLNDAITYEGIVYNKAAFAAAGIEEVPRTTAEFMDACQKLSDAGIIAMSTSLKDVWPIYPWVTWDSVQIVLNGSTEGKNLYIENDLLFDDTMMKSFNILRDLNVNGLLEPDVMSANWDQMKLDMSQGKAAMHYTGGWFPVQLVELGADEGDIGMFPFPDSKAISVMNAKQWGVSSTSAYPEEAKDFLKYMIEEGRYTTATGETSGYKSATPDNPAIEELLSYGLEGMSPNVVDPEFTNRLNGIECDPNSVLQAYVTELNDEKAAEMIDDWNEKWAAARNG